MIDSYAWIEHFIGSEEGRRVKEIMENADEVYTPDTVLAEIARKYIREGAEDKKVAARLEEIIGMSNITRVDGKLALEAARCYLELAAKARKTKHNVSNRQGKREYLSDSKTNDLARRFYAYLDWHIKIPRIRHGDRSSIETLISEEALLLAMYLRNEKKYWIPRIEIAQ